MSCDMEKIKDISKRMTKVSCIIYSGDINKHNMYQISAFLPLIKLLTEELKE